MRTRAEARLFGAVTATDDLSVSSGGRAILDGVLSAGNTARVSAVGPIDVAGSLSGGVLASVASSSGVRVLAGGSIDGATVAVRGGGAVLLAGSVTAALALEIESINAGIDIEGVSTSGGSLVIAARGGELVLRGQVSADGSAEFLAATNVSVAGGSVAAESVGILSGGAIDVGGAVTATLDAMLTSVNDGIVVSAAVSAGRDLVVLAGRGDLFLGANVVAGTTATLEATAGAILQPSAGVTVKAAAATLLAAGAIGRPGQAVDLVVGKVAGEAGLGGLWLSQTAAAGNLTVAPVGAARGLRSPGTVSVTTANGDLVVAGPILGSAVELIADRAPGSGARGRVIFDRGYVETAAGRVVNSPPGNTPVDAAGDPIVRFDLASPFVISFGIRGGSVSQTVDGLLADRGLTVSVDFIQPDSYDSSQRRIQSITDLTGRLAASGFGPFSFRYSELFLQDRLIAGGAREQLFNIVVTASQDDSIRIDERIGGVTVVDATSQTFTFGNVSTSPTEQSLSIPLGIVSPVFASVEVPLGAVPGRALPPVETTPYVAAPAAVPLEVEASEASAASAGASSADRPRLFLVWRRPGDSGEPTAIEIDLIWFARDYQRQLIAHLKEGHYWFELAEPGASVRQLGDAFYVRNGRVIDVPTYDGQTGESAGDGGSDGSSPTSGEMSDVSAPAVLVPTGTRSEEESSPPPDASAAGLTPAASAVGLIVLAGRRWRGRFESAFAAETAGAPLGKTSRLQRRLRACYAEGQAVKDPVGGL